MFSLLTLASSVVITANATSTTATIISSTTAEEKQFLAWMKEFSYSFVGTEYEKRFAIWNSNRVLVNNYNAGNHGFKLALNKFAHLTSAEYKALLGLKNNVTKNSVKETKTAVASIDWRKKGIVNAIKDQGNCGSCWAFSVTQAQESQWAKVYGSLHSLSEQNLVDCVTTSYGCDGGYIDYTYLYVINKQGGKFMLESDYPYTQVQGKCKFNKLKGITKITGYRSVATFSETDLAYKVATYGPAAVGIDASHYSFQLYSSGIYNEPACSSVNLDHAVGCVGFGYAGSTNYWIIRNSWGASWGESGYIRMIRNGSNQCGVATDATVPIDQ